MSRWLRSSSLLLLALVGCANGNLWRDSKPIKPPPKKVIIDAEWSAEQPSEELRRAILERTEARATDDGATTFNRQQTATADGGEIVSHPSYVDRAPADQNTVSGSWQRIEAHAVTAAFFSDNTPDIDSESPARNSFSAMHDERAPRTQSTPASTTALLHDSSTVPVDAPSNKNTRSSLGTKARDPPLLIVAHEMHPLETQVAAVLRLSGVIEDGTGQAMALLDIKGQGTVYARTGESLDIHAGGRAITVCIGKISNHSVSVQLGSESRVMVLR